MAKSYTFAPKHSYIMIDTELRYQQILLTITQYQNGDVSNSMIKHGLNYKTNYGVSIPIIDKIAEKYPLDSELAVYLWNQDERESKLLALRLFNNKLDNELITKMVIDGIENSELAEQASQYYFIRLENSTKIALDLIKNTNEYCNLAGLILISKLAQNDKNLGNETFSQFIDELKNLKLCHSFHQKRGLARALLQIGLRNTDLKHHIINWIDIYSIENSEYKNWIEQEVKYYLTN